MKKTRDTNEAPHAADKRDGADHSRLDPEMTGQIDLSPIAKEMMKAEADGKIPCLVVLGGMDVGSVITVGDRELTLGRGGECDVHLQDDGISRRHAKVRVNARGELVVQDLRSTNGTYVRGQRISMATLAAGDKVLLGRRTVLKYMVHDRIDQDYQQEIYTSTTRDPLTKAHNRKYLTQRLVTDLSYARRHHQSLGLVMFDIDHFKEVNDTFGHPTGDQVLMAVCEVVSRMIRAEDVLARYGGEEFCVLAQGIDLEGARRLAEKIRREVSKRTVTALIDSRSIVRVSVSVGVAVMTPGAAVDSATLIAQADENLYKAKNAGRDRVVASEIN